MTTEFILAIIAAATAIIVALIQKGRSENKSDHNVVASLLKEVHHDVINIENKLDDVESKIDIHIDNHITTKIPKIIKKK